MSIKPIEDAPLISVDARGRVNLGKLTKKGRFAGSMEPDGTIILTPVEMVPATDTRRG